MKLTPLHDWAVIKPSPAEDVSAGGLYLPDTAKEKPAQGVVEAIGPGALEEEHYDKKKKKDLKDRKFIATTVKPGDYVLYEQYAGQTYKVGDEDRVLVRERNILGMLPGGEPKANPAPKQLQLPSTSASRNTAIVPAGTRAITTSGKKELATLSSLTPKKPAQPKKKTAKKTVKKAIKKKTTPAKKAAKKAVSAKKNAVKKAAKKSVKKAVKKSKPATSKRKTNKPAKKKR